jgi:hypothetical protein
MTDDGAVTTVLFALDVGGYVVSCDVDARGGRGAVTLSSIETDAKRFATGADALAYWKRPSTVCPVRPDGQPNRPLSAYSVELRKVGA